MLGVSSYFCFGTWGFKQHSKVNIGSDINFGGSRSISRFTEYKTKSATRERTKDKKPVQRASSEVISNGQGSSSSTSAVQCFPTPANSGNDFQILSRETIESIKIGKVGATLLVTKQCEVQWEVLNFSHTAIDNKLRCISPGSGDIMPSTNNRKSMVSGGEKISHKCAGAKGNQIGNNGFYYNKEEGNFHLC